MKTIVEFREQIRRDAQFGRHISGATILSLLDDLDELETQRDEALADLAKHDEDADYNAKQLYVQIHALRAELARKTEALRKIEAPACEGGCDLRDVTAVARAALADSPKAGGPVKMAAVEEAPRAVMPESRAKDSGSPPAYSSGTPPREPDPFEAKARGWFGPDGPLGCVGIDGLDKEDAIKELGQKLREVHNAAVEKCANACVPPRCMGEPWSNADVQKLVDEFSGRCRALRVPTEGSGVEVELHQTHPAAVEAVRATMRALPGGDLIEKDGKFYVPAGFPAFAAERQGYVKRVVHTGKDSER